ncbi:chitin deacetylase 1-like [Saccostrea echinata]|uniref:chitin deacetylase 1-like n=1 Tax=Saccostrea echinata TaxID=191078 RepID=UPI002A7F3CF6|nr:chitin deacetylase 1-like [Saccostrea echinata]
MSLLLAALATLVLRVTAQGGCDPASNCQLPNCRCFLDSAVPGGLNMSDVPQLVVLTMDYILNEEYEPLYNQIFVVNNPNGCEIRGTFFVQDQGSNLGLVKRYADGGFEIGINSIDGTIPTTEGDMVNMMKTVKQDLKTAGIDDTKVKGVRLPQLATSGDTEFTAIGNNGLLYDAGCVTNQYDQQLNYKWPFTYDYPPTENLCTTGTSATRKYPGKWQVLVADLTWKGNKCPSPAGCAGVDTQKDVFDLLYNNFASHYEGNKEPYVIVLDPLWMKTDYKLEGTIEFVDYVRAAFDDVWVVTADQMLQWVQTPTKNSDLNNFAPFQC